MHFALKAKGDVQGTLQVLQISITQGNALEFEHLESREPISTPLRALAERLR